MTTKPVPFSAVLKRELEEVKRRRDGTHKEIPKEQQPPEEPAAGREAELLRDQQNDALKENLVGLAISGGGIRSATFALGFLQGLARFRALGLFDYLSTVSGGGFIGGWLAAWIKRDGDLGNVEKQLDPDRVQQATANRGPEAAGTVLDAEPEPVQHLRAYSNYLAPRMNLFSLDGWALLTIYLRNLLLNQIVLVLFILGVLCGVVFVAKSYCFGVTAFQMEKGAPSTTPLASQRCLGVGVTCFVLGCLCLLCLHHYVASPPGTSQQRSRRSSQESILFCLAVILLLVAALFCSFMAVRLTSNLAPAWPFHWGSSCKSYQFHDWLCVFASVGMGLHLLVTFLSWGTLYAVTGALRSTFWGGVRSVMAALLAGTVGGILACCVLYCLAPWNEKDDALQISLLFLLGPPLLLGVFILANMLNIGLMGSQLTEAEREFWAATAARLVRIGVLLVVLLALVMYGPMLLLYLFSDQGMALLTSASLASWAAFILASLRAAQSKETGDAPATSTIAWIKECLAQLGIWVFVGGLLIGIMFVCWQLVHFEAAPGVGHAGAMEYLKTLLAHDKGWTTAWVAGLIIVVVSILLGCLVNINIFSLQGVYAGRLIRCYLGASRPKERTPQSERHLGAPTNNVGEPRNPHPVTGFDPKDDLPLSRLQYGAQSTPDQERPYDGPLLLVNTALNLVQGDELAWSERKADAFVMTPYHCGSYSTGYTPTVHQVEPWNPGDPPLWNGYGGGLTLGTAMSVSGAAVSPNMGFHSSAGVTLFLTLFNARLGAWFGNPAGQRSFWTLGGNPVTQRRPVFGLFYLFREMFGRTNSRDEYIYLSDGGHFENLGVYELLRRRCRFILLLDGGADGNFTLEDLGNLVRKARVDFGITIELDLNALRRKPPAKAGAHVVVGKIHYDGVHRTVGEKVEENPAKIGQREGVLVYVKPTLTGDESADIENYQAEHPVFPNDPTTEQFYSESRFESYRMLGYHTAVRILEPIWRQHPGWVDEKKERPTPRSHNDAEEVFKGLLSYWHPTPPDFDQQYLAGNQQYIYVHDLLRREPLLRWLAAELSRDPDAKPDRDSPPVPQPKPEEEGLIEAAEYHTVAQLMTVLENAWIGMNLERYRLYPIMDGWLRVFRQWARSLRLQKHWSGMDKEFNQRFRDYFQGLIEEEKARKAPANSTNPTQPTNPSEATDGR